MKYVAILRRSIIMLSLLTGFTGLMSQTSGRVDENFNFGWKFHKGDIQGGEKIVFDDSSWRNVDLPHDWSIEGPFSKENYSCTAYLPGGIGWYRKSFRTERNISGRKYSIYFGGVYNNSEVWINGHSLGKRPNGYISFQYDLTPYLEKGKTNVIAVKVDHSLFGDSRWYTGSGIYRNVRLIITDPVHIKKWGVNYTTPEVTKQKASVKVYVVIANELSSQMTGTLSNFLLFGTDTISKTTGKVDIDKASEKSFSAMMDVDYPKLWDIDNPNLYTLVTVLRCKGSTDRIVTPVGIRTTQFDPDHGFSLNGRSLKLKGICMHHEAGALGSAVPQEEIARRLDILKEMGCNAIRTSHNPFAQEFLDLCDQKGFLVLGEAFDEWELPKKKWLAGWNAGTPGKEGYSAYFAEWHKQDLTDFILRDRNHPSVIMWSIGNEIDYPNDPYTHPVLNTEANPQTWAKFSDQLPNAERLGQVARELVSIIKSIDPSRPVTAGLASALMSNETGYADALDVAGYNYQEFRYAPDHAKYPSRPLYGSENGMTLDMWNYVADNEYVMGQFLWTGIEYLGEAGRYPVRSNTAGVIDLAGNRKPEFYFRQSIWSDKPMVFIGTSDRPDNGRTTDLWAHKRVEPLWNYQEGKKISVNAFSNCEEVELFLNSRSLGSKKMADFKNRTITWDVPFEKGTLKAVARNKGTEVAAFELKTTGNVSTIAATTDNYPVKTGRESLAHVYINLCDDNGNIVYNADNEVTCTVTGPVRLIGMDDSNPSNTEDYKDNRQHAYHGKLIVYLKPADKAGEVTVSLSSPGLKSTPVSFTVVK
jgi:beta-galactosidase